MSPTMVGPGGVAVGQAEAKQAVGRAGEEMAATWLEGRGWRVVARNWRCKAGEADIVAIEPGGTLVFVEVKCRSGRGFGSPLEAITRAKLASMRQVAGCWVAQRGTDGRPIRLDAVGITWRRGHAPEIDHVEKVA